MPRSRWKGKLWLVGAWLSLSLGIASLSARADELLIQKSSDSAPRRLVGTILEEAQDQSLLFESVDGRLWILQATEVLERASQTTPVQSLTPAEYEQQLLSEFDGFQVLSTDHFLIVYNTERAFAQWLGGLYEQLFKGFSNYWERKRKFELHDPKFPLVIVAYASFEEYSAHVQRELGQAPRSMVAYYNLLTNRVTLYDLTAGFRSSAQMLDNDRKIYEILANPNALPMVATVVHEGTHQLMFNMGMQTRMSDTPLWVNEGLAMFFETPDLKNPKGWRTIGQINALRLGNFRESLASRVGGGEALKDLLTNDAAFRDPQRLLGQYAEAWAWNYFLLNKYGKEYVNYLKTLQAKRPLRVDSPEQRLADFQTAFQIDWAQLDREFLEYVQKLRD